MYFKSGLSIQKYIEELMKKIIVSLFIISVFFNVVFICYIIGKGITLNNYNTYNQQQYQQQWQGQLLLNQWTAQGNKIEWKRIDNVKSYNNSIEESIQDHLNKLHPISSLYAKVIVKYHNNGKGDTVDIIYPDIFVEKEKK